MGEVVALTDPTAKKTEQRREDKGPMGALPGESSELSGLWPELQMASKLLSTSCQLVDDARHDFRRRSGGGELAITRPGRRDDVVHRLAGREHIIIEAKEAQIGTSCRRGE